MWQPGPLTKPPKQRSRKTPSFRIIDFGRGEDWDEYKDQDDGKDLERKMKDWKARVDDERESARTALLISDYDY